MLSIFARQLTKSDNLFYNQILSRLLIGGSVKRQQLLCHIDAKEKIEVKSLLKGWAEKLKAAGVGDIDFNLKCLVAHTLKQKFVSIFKFIIR